MSTTSMCSSIISLFHLVIGAMFMTSQFHLANSQVPFKATDDFLNTCTDVPPKTTDKTIVYVDWPFTLSCDDLVESSGVPLTSSNSLCLVSSKDVSPQLSNISITLNMTSPQSSTYTLSQVINCSQCFSTNVTIELRPLPARSCADDVDYYLERNVSLVYKRLRFGDELRLDCITAPDAGNEAVFPPEVPTSSYKTIWYRTKVKEDYSRTENRTCKNYFDYRTCENYHNGLGRSNREQLSNPLHPDSILKYRLNYYDPGIYSCSVVYNDQTAYVVHYAVCVENNIERSVPTVQCNTVKHFYEEESVEIECSVQSSNAKIEKDQLEVQWTKIDSDGSYDCQTLYLSSEQSGGKATCDLVDFYNLGTKCFWYTADDQELNMYQDKNTFKIRYTLSKVKKSDAGVYQVKLRYENLWSNPSNVTIEIRPLLARSCADDVDYYFERNVILIYKRLRFGDELRLDCITAPDAGNEAVFPPEVPTSSYKTTWYRTKVKEDYSMIEDRTCEDYSKELGRSYGGEQVNNSPHPDSIWKYRLNYYDPGIYSCSVVYNDQTAYVVHYAICVENNIERSVPTVQCNTIKHFYEEESVEIECSVQSSNAKIEKDQLEVQWTKIDSDGSYDCQTLYLSSEQSGGKATCDLVDFYNLGTKCFWYMADDQELNMYQDKNTFKIRYTLSYINKSDTGVYQVKLRYENLWSEPWNVTLTFNPARELRYIITILVSVLAVLTAILVAIGLIWYNWIQILLFIRRHFRQPTEDNKEFVAIISYLFSNDLAEEAKEHTKKIVHCIRKRMDKMNYSFYDKHQDSKGGSTVETLLKNLNHSHRMVIVLTDAYVEERWARFEAQQGYINMMKNKTKLIIVRAPGARSALKRSTERGEEFSQELMVALKASRNIHWKNNMKEDRFMDDIEYALPNLKRSSSSSEEQTFHFNKIESTDLNNSNHIPSSNDAVASDLKENFFSGTNENIV